MTYKRYRLTILSILGSAILGLFFLSTMATNYNALAASIPFALQDTKLSGPDPTPGHEQQHQAVTVLPPRNDSKIYSGTVTYASSIPVEVIVLHPFNLTQPTNNTFTPEPLTVPGQNITISVIHGLGEAAQFDTVDFAGSSLAFHSRTPQNFTVSYTIAGNLVDATGVPK